MAEDKYLDKDGEPLEETDKAKITQAKIKANQWLEKVITTLEEHQRSPDPYTEKLLNAYYKTTKTNDTDTIINRFKRAKRQLNKGLTFTLYKDWKGIHGAVGKTESASMSLGKEFDLGSVEDRAATLIHESTHLTQGAYSAGNFRPTFFWSEKEWYVFKIFKLHDPSNSVAAWNNLKSSGLMDNTDTYAAFAAAVNDANYFNGWGAMPKVLRNHLGLLPVKQHTVKPGDWLSKIAQSYYNGQRDLWPIIYDANVGRVGIDFNKLRPGQKLVIPDISLLPISDLAAARRRAAQWKPTTFRR